MPFGGRQNGTVLRGGGGGGGWGWEHGIRGPVLGIFTVVIGIAYRLIKKY